MAQLEPISPKQNEIPMMMDSIRMKLDELSSAIDQIDERTITIRAIEQAKPSAPFPTATAKSPLAQSLAGVVDRIRNITDKLNEIRSEIQL